MAWTEGQTLTTTGRRSSTTTAENNHRAGAWAFALAAKPAASGVVDVGRGSGRIALAAGR
jgi:hypothetical protein